ncbi:hypothetical protein CHLNCDRAFT_141064 [Chlorella variabilis]|uniref:Complex 1 LYR protein domain-containing protein n=1 Tax=Chlorella variabilis TaxID=554065 RepID=E1ZS37_CHLVA|nr:hypothetical protein CHLNCDRAFT_141064 [Chlorella variabilis]EFN51348.1 hypothetical protein CHLNCDRAFT_141064 [Chlorella variabilis]|eukprot:XP_005843450.1 hypothetical protein CHLNCDRAFT_141064 [Chlorella variabilis]
MSAPALNVYRGLLRSASAAFKGDATMLSAAQQEIRAKFEESRHVSDPAQRQQLLQEGSEAADFIRTSIVQAASNERGAFEMKIGEDHLGGLVEEVTPDMKLPKERKKK